MNLILMFGAVLVALLVSALPALVWKQHYEVMRQFFRLGMRGIFWELAHDELGAIAVAYYARNVSGVTILGSSTPPTAIQSSALTEIQAQVAMGDADTQALFTHNWGLDASAPGYYEPRIHHYCLLQGPLTASFLPLLTFDVTNTNVIKINKPNLGGSAGTFIVTAYKPHSITR